MSRTRLSTRLTRFVVALFAALTPVFAASCGGATATHSAATTPTPTAEPVASSSAADHGPKESDRFDFKVREDFFAGVAGNADAMARAMKVCEDALAANPNDPEALVWHGAGVLFQAGQAFQKGDAQAGMALWKRGMEESDRAVTLAPENVGVRIPRGAGFLAMTHFVRDEATRKDLLTKGLDDYETTLRVQAPYFARLPVHARAELLYGLGDGWSQMGDQARARGYFRRLVDECAGSPLAPRAQAWLDGKPKTDPAPCGDCHAQPRAR